MSDMILPIAIIEHHHGRHMKYYYVNYAYVAFKNYIIKFGKFGKLICLISQEETLFC